MTKGKSNDILNKEEKDRLEVIRKQEELDDELGI